MVLNSLRYRTDTPQGVCELFGLKESRVYRTSFNIGTGTRRGPFDTLFSLSHLEKFRSCVGRTAAPGGERKARHKPVGETKIRQLNIPLRIEQQVLRLEIPMHHAIVVTIVHCGQNLTEFESGLVFTGPPATHDIVENLPVGRQLHHNVDKSLRFHDLVAVLRIRDVYPGRLFSIPDPGSEFFPLRISRKEFKYQNPKNGF
jgi:hypothetical protein